MVEFIKKRKIFGTLVIPENGNIVGYAALLQRYDVDASIRVPSCIMNHSIRTTRRVVDGWVEFDRRLAPEDSLIGHLVFALRHENLDLLALDKLFSCIPEEEMVDAISLSVTGLWVRRIWFLYEWLTGRMLPIPSLQSAVPYVDLLDDRVYYTARGTNSVRHRVRDNLLGVRTFCPVVRRTEFLRELEAENLDEEAKSIVSSSDKRLLAKAISSLVLQDSQASYTIEGEIPPKSKLERFASAVMEAGKNDLSVVEFERLQKIILEKGFNTNMGIRREGVFIGERFDDHTPNPLFIGARPDDIGDLIAGLLASNEKMSESNVPAIIHAASISFGFVMIHPFEDGNGRIHRFLVHHILARRGFAPPGFIFPVSVVILKDDKRYATALGSHSGPLMKFIDWIPTDKYNVFVKNDTANLYQYFDATLFVEFLGYCVQETIRYELPNEISRIACYDKAVKLINDKYDLSNDRLSLLVSIIRENNWKLSAKKYKSHFSYLSNEQVHEIENLVARAHDII